MRVESGNEAYRKTFPILDALDREEIFHTADSSRNNSGISIGEVNYILKSLLDKGFLKISNFRHSQNKNSLCFISLHQKGSKKKSKLAVKFVFKKA
jgi:hypothetical protein